MYPWGDGFDGYLANFCDKNCPFSQANRKYLDGYIETAPVGQYPAGASPYGVLDMAGNVWEWVADWYAEDYYSSSPSNHPQGPDSGDYRVVRGGSWHFAGFSATTANRNKYYPEYSVDNIGFRCALDVFVQNTP